MYRCIKGGGLLVRLAKTRERVWKDGRKGRGIGAVASWYERGGKK